MGEKTTSVKIKNYKCFRKEFAGFEQICPINIIIGRNNSGKSSLLDLINLIIQRKQQPTNKNARTAQYQFSEQAPLEILKMAFSESIISSSLGGDLWNQHGKFLEEIIPAYETDASFRIDPATITWKNEKIFEKHWSETPASVHTIENRKEFLLDKYKKGLVIAPFFEEKNFHRLAADRDIRPEHQSTKLELEINGTGATNIIRAYISDSDRETSAIKKTLLEALNQIFEPDCKFTEINIQQHKAPDGEYREHEVYLTEKAKGSIELSMSGSGLKTIILVLLNMLIVPLLKQGSSDHRPIKDYIFAFEELENNLHPALLRRLFRYIENFAGTNKCHFYENREVVNRGRERFMCISQTSIRASFSGR